MEPISRRRLSRAVASVCDRLSPRDPQPRWQLQALESRLLLSGSGPELLSESAAIHIDPAALSATRAHAVAHLPRAAYAGARNQDLYDRWLVISPTASSEVKSTIADVTVQLRQMTGRNFDTVSKTTGRGIFFVRAADAGNYSALSAHQARLTELANRGSEAFFIYSAGDKSLYIVGNSDNALGHGAYHYLERLGWRALLPGANWLITPQRDDIRITVDEVREPAFRQREFFGTGGFGGASAGDPDMSIEGAWSQYRDRNLWGGSISIGGHAGQAFNTDERTWLEANEQARPLVKNPNYGQPGEPEFIRAPWSYQMKPDDTYGPLQERYVDHRVNAYTPGSFAVSVEPADGGGYASNPEYYQWSNGDTPPVVLDSVSDHVFNLANLVARELQSAHPGAFASLYAYNRHGAVPDVELEDNIFVSVVPYGFNYTGMNPNDLLAAWAAKKPDGNKGVRDYWAIPDWYDSMPQLSAKAIADRLKLWNSLNYAGFNAESVYSAGAMGVQLYVASKLIWDPSLNTDALINEFYDLAFGAAAGPMKRMVERWGKQMRLHDQELAKSFRELQKARELAADDPGALARVNDFGRYVQWMRSYLELQEARVYPAGNSIRQAAADAFFSNMWRAHESGMVHSYRMHQLTMNAEGGDPYIAARWSITNPNAAGWQTITPISDSEIASLIDDGAADYPLLFDEPVFSSTLVPRETSIVLDGVMDSAMAHRRNENFTFYAPPGITELDFEILNRGVNLNLDNNPEIVTVRNAAGAVVWTGEYDYNNGIWEQFTVPIAASGNYTMTVEDFSHGFYLKAERNLPFVVTGDINSGVRGPEVYFYVPAGQTKVAIFAQGALPIVIKDSSNTVVTPSYGTGQGVTVYDVPPGQDDAVWGMYNLAVTVPGAALLNVPSNWSYTRQGMMIPINAAPTVDAGWDAAIVSPVNVANLNGSVVDDGFPSGALTSTWTKVSGPGTVTFGNAADPDTTATFSTPGTYVLRLTADDTEETVFDEVTITYHASAPNKAPTVSAGSDAALTLPNGTLNLDGTVSDDGKPTVNLTHAWTLVSGPGRVVFADDDAVDTTATFQTPGEYVLRLQSDDGELASFDELKVTVLPDYAAPTNAIGDTGLFGTTRGWSFNAIGGTLSSVNHQYSARFRAFENLTVDRAYQRLVGIDANTTIEVGIMADDGTGKPTGTFLASTGSYNPPDGDSLAWAVFTQPVALQAGQVYHVVTKVTGIGTGESFRIYSSSSSNNTRPYDNANDPMFGRMVSTDGGQSWSTGASDPFLVLGNGATVVSGPGHAYSGSSSTLLQTQGGTGRATGQKFKIFDREVPADARVEITGLTLSLTTAGSPTDPLVVKLRKDDGTVLGRFSVLPSEANGTARTWSFDNSVKAVLHVGEHYLITTEFGGAGGTTSQYYRALSRTAAAAQGNATWGGIVDCVPIQSGTSNSWSSWNPYSDYADMYVGIEGEVVPHNPVYDVGMDGTFGNSEVFGYSVPGLTLDGTNDEFSIRVQPRERITVDRVMQRLIGIDANTRIEVGIMADDGHGNPDGRYLASTGIHDPANGDSMAWAVFEEGITLEPTQVYHIVTQVTAISGGESFKIYASSANQAIRPFDRAADPYMTILRRANGGSWADGNLDPYFLMAHGVDGAGNPVVVQGTGQPVRYTVSSHLHTYGGTGKAIGQKFQISIEEVPHDAVVNTTGLTLRIYNAGAPTDPLLVMLRKEDGTILGQFSVLPSEADGTTRTWTFDGGTTVGLKPGETYLITSQFGGTGGSASQSYSFLSTAVQTTHADGSWGGSATCVSIQSGSSNNWGTWSPFMTISDLWFRIDGEVELL